MNPVDANHVPDCRRGGFYLVNPVVHGEWHLWIDNCDWQAKFVGDLVADSESPSGEIERGPHMLNGQKLLRVSAHGGETPFAFDLGGVLETTPYENDRSSSTWLLYTPSGLVLTYRSDG